MKQQQFILSEVAKLLDMKAHVIAYAISSGSLPEPSLRIFNKRIFTLADVERIRKYFANKPVSKEARK